MDESPDIVLVRSANDLRSRSERGQTAFALLEASLTALLGGIVSRYFTSLLLAAFDSSPTSVVWIGLLFHGWPGVLDIMCLGSVGQPAFTKEGLIAWATVAGAVIGFWDGWHQIHNWRRWKGLTFLIDVTWGGAAVGFGVVGHFINFGWGNYIVSRRVGAHRYDSGFAMSRPFAITVGNVCSNLRGQADGGLFRHEAVHVLQNRLFGPIYLYSYVGWMAVFLIPALVYGATMKRPFAVAFSWCYCNNPWEEWAYRYGGSRDPAIVWPTGRIVGVTVVIFAAATATIATLLVKASGAA
jgi:hypothetical protein